jgi:hypothetical protein
MSSSKRIRKKREGVDSSSTAVVKDLVGESTSVDSVERYLDEIDAQEEKVKCSWKKKSSKLNGSKRLSTPKRD